jgi:hypothetical protein
LTESDPKRPRTVQSIDPALKKAAEKLYRSMKGTIFGDRRGSDLNAADVERAAAYLQKYKLVIFVTVPSAVTFKTTSSTQPFDKNSLKEASGADNAVRFAIKLPLDVADRDTIRSRLVHAQLSSSLADVATDSYSLPSGSKSAMQKPAEFFKLLMGTLNAIGHQDQVLHASSRSATPPNSSLLQMAKALYNMSDSKKIIEVGHAANLAMIEFYKDESLPRKLHNILYNAAVNSKLVGFSANLACDIAKQITHDDATLLDAPYLPYVRDEWKPDSAFIREMEDSEMSSTASMSSSGPLAVEANSSGPFAVEATSTLYVPVPVLTAATSSEYAQ